MWEIASALSNPPLSLPPTERKLGPTTVSWFESQPGIAIISCEGGTVDDRWLAEVVTRESLAACGIKQARFSVDRVAHSELSGPNWDFYRENIIRKEATWDDIMAKAKRLNQSGNVTLLRNGYNIIVAHVIGDHGEYTCEISRDDPQSRTITQWTCECPWDQYAFQRTRKWKKYEARPCAHVLAAYWKSLGTPLDEDVEAGGGPPPTGPMGPAPAVPPAGGIATPDGFTPHQAPLPVQGQPGPQFDGQMPPAPGGMPPAPPGGPTPLSLMAPQPSQLPPLMAPPGGNQIIPPFPMDPNQLAMPISVPGGRPGPYPANPIQQPGTFSKVILASTIMYHATNPRNRDSIQREGLMLKYDQAYTTPELGEHGHGTGGTRPGVYLTARPMHDSCGQDHWAVDTSGLDVRPDPWGTNMKIFKDNPYLSEYGGSFYVPHDIPPHKISLHRPAQNGCANPECEDCGGILDDDDSHTAAANDQFSPGSTARINEATYGQAEGREGATDAGQWMEVPKNAMVEVRDQDQTTGWVEIIYPLKGGPMTSYHVRCFVEPEKLTPMDRHSPFQNPRRSNWWEEDDFEQHYDDLHRHLEQHLGPHRHDGYGGFSSPHGSFSVDFERGGAPGAMFLEGFQATQPGRGWGTKVMNALKGYADQAGVPIAGTYPPENASYYQRFPWLQMENRGGHGRFNYSPQTFSRVADGLPEIIEHGIPGNGDMIGRPFIFQPRQNKLHLGQDGSYHRTVYQSMEEQGHMPVGQEGVIYMPDGKVQWCYGAQPHDGAMQALQRHYGQPLTIHVPEWHSDKNWID